MQNGLFIVDEKEFMFPAGVRGHSSPQPFRAGGRASRDETMSVSVNGELVPVGGGDNIPLIRETLTIGRRESCDIRLPFPNLSQLHCELSFKDGYWYIRDLNSTNGI